MPPAVLHDPVKRPHRNLQVIIRSFAFVAEVMSVLHSQTNIRNRYYIKY